MDRADVNTGLLVAAFLMAGVGAWAGFGARAQIDKDYQDLYDLAESNLEMIEAIGERVDKGFAGGGMPLVESGTEGADAEGDSGGGAPAAIGSLQVALAEANKRISRVHEDRRLLQDRVRRHIEETRVLEARLVAAEEEQARLAERIQRLVEQLPKGPGLDLREETQQGE